VLQSTHPYQLSVDPSGLIQLYYDLSEEETVTEGFVVIGFQQSPDLPTGTQIISEFQLQTDFDEYLSDGWLAFHRVGEDFVIVDAVAPAKPDIQLNCYPNPAQEMVHINIAGLPRSQSAVQVEIRNQLGQLVEQFEQAGPLVTWQPKNLPPGLYQLALSQNNSYIGTIKLILN